MIFLNSFCLEVYIIYRMICIQRNCNLRKDVKRGKDILQKRKMLGLIIAERLVNSKVSNLTYQLKSEENCERELFRLEEKKRWLKSRLHNANSSEINSLNNLLSNINEDIRRKENKNKNILARKELLNSRLSSAKKDQVYLRTYKMVLKICKPIS